MVTGMNINPDSFTPQETRPNALRCIMSEVFCEGKIDRQKLRVTLGADIDFPMNDTY